MYTTLYVLNYYERGKVKDKNTCTSNSEDKTRTATDDTS